MFGMNESYESPEEKAFEAWEKQVKSKLGFEINDSLALAMFEDRFTVEEAVEEAIAQKGE